MSFNNFKKFVEKMKKIYTILFGTLSFISVQAQNDKSVIKTDFNGNGVVDLFKTNVDVLEMKIDNINYSIDYGTLECDNIGLGLKNKILILETSMRGTGLYTRIYKFRKSKKTNQIELIGYDYSFRITQGGNYNLSYNAITGDYEIGIAIPNKKRDGFDGKSYKGKKVISKIYLSDIKINTLDNLFKIGVEYEQKL